MNNQIVTYHISSETPLLRTDNCMAKVLDACLTCKAFIVGYNVKENLEGPDEFLLAISMKDDDNLKSTFELLTKTKLVKLEKRT